MISMDNDRKWHLAWAELDAFENNLPGFVKEKHVSDFRAILDLLQQSSGEDTSHFRIPDSEVQPQVVAAIRGGYNRPGRTIYGDKGCDRSLMLRKIQSVRGYFQRINPPPEKPKVGF